MTVDLELEKVRLAYEDGLGILTLNDPAALNVMGHQMGADLAQAAGEIARRPEYRALLINAEGKHFCGGGDLKAMQAGFADDPKAFFETALSSIHEAVLALHNLPIPIVTAVQGFAAGAGANFALVGDLLVAADNAQFFQAFTQVGVAVDSGGSWFLPRALGDKRALYYLLTGAKLSAADAHALGLVSKVVPLEKLASESHVLARQLAQGPTVAYGEIRRLVAMAHRNDLASQLAAEQVAQVRCGETRDFQSGVNAFLAKAAPEFSGE